ncbi:hypothetical protein KAU45_10950 [bacterium]|nr:hypothetical protein [bacterium]
MSRVLTLLPFLLAIQAAQAEIVVEIGDDEAYWPTLGGNVMLQYYHYLGEDDPDLGYCVPSNRFAARHAVIGVNGELGEYIEYGAEFGVATCAGSGGDDATVKNKEAEIFFKPIEWLGLGIARGHVMRGFMGKQECYDMPLCEKPHFFFTYGQCHMFGAQVWAKPMFTDEIGISLELGYYNGVAGTVDIESNTLGGLWVHLPYGVTVGGHYENVVVDYDFDGDYDDVWRASAGLRWEQWGIHLQGEYYLGTGFNANYGTVEPADLERNAYYVQAAYDILTGFDVLPYVQPHIRYESYDQGVNADDDLDHTYSWLTAGISVGLGSSDAALKIDYDYNLTEERDYEAKAADAIYVRLQAGF